MVIDRVENKNTETATLAKTGSAVTADLKVLTRVKGVAPETVYFSATDSVSDNETDFAGGTDQKAIAVSKLAYHFNFDDADSGHFATTGRSRNQQLGHASRALHTFDCQGNADPNWDASAGACVFNVGVRVQDSLGSYDDAFVRVEIETQADYYGSENTVCVSATSNWAGCPVGALHTNDSPLAGEFSGKRVLYQRGSTAVYSDIEISYGEKNITIDTYGTGTRPQVNNVVVGYERLSDSNAREFDMLGKDASGYVDQGWAFNTTITGLRLGTLAGGQAVTLLTAHDLDLDWSQTANNQRFGSVAFASGAYQCVNDDDLSCQNLHYPYGVFITDSVVKGYRYSLPKFNIGCESFCMPVNSGMAGNDVKTVSENNAEFMGSWGLVVTDNWLRGNHLGGRAKRKLELRTPGSLSDASQFDGAINPENFAAGGHIRGTTAAERYLPSLSVIANNMINDEAQDSASRADRFVVVEKYHRYVGIYNNAFISDAQSASSGKLAVLSVGGRHIYAMDNALTADYLPCVRSSTEVAGYHDVDSILAIAEDWSGFGAPVGSECAMQEIAAATPGAPYLEPVHDPIFGDNQPPKIALIGKSYVSVALGSTYVDQGVLEAMDSEDGDLYDALVTDLSAVDTSRLGNFTVAYSVTDSDGATTRVERNVTVASAGTDDGSVHASLKVLTRVKGVAPETVYFSAMDSTSDNERDLSGGTDATAIAVSKLSYHFNFDDADSGYFKTTGRSRNMQHTNASRAIHTFDCKGAVDDNWDSGKKACLFNVGVRVQDSVGHYDDAFVQVEIQTQDDYYSATDTICVSATANWDGCPDGAIHTTDSPLPGEYSGKRVLYQRGSDSVYGNIAIQYSEKNVTIDTYGEGARPTVYVAQIGGISAKDSNVHTFDMIARDADGYISQGWAYNVTITGLRLGTFDGGTAATLLTLHDLDLDWSNTPNEGGYGRAYFSSNASWCESSNDLTCSNVPYPYGIFITDSVIKGHISSLPLINIGCFNSCMVVNSGMAGNDVKTADEHNSRVMGSWGFVVANNWLRGDHLGGPGAKSKLTLRVAGGAQAATSLNKAVNPEDFAAGGHLRQEGSENQYLPSFAVVVNNLVNDTDQNPNSVAASFVQLDKYYHYSGIYSNDFQVDAATAESGKFSVIVLSGIHSYSVNNRVPPQYVPCTRSSKNEEGYHDASTLRTIASDWSGFDAPIGSQCTRESIAEVVPSTPGE